MPVLKFTRILITADLHLSDLPRDAYRHTFQKWLRETVKKYQAEAVLVLGDITEDKDYHSASLVNAIVDHFYRLSAICDVFVLQGNHDGPSPDNPYHQFLGRIEGVYWIGEPLIAQQSKHEAIRALGNVLFLPYTPDPERDWTMDMKGYDWIFTHNSFAGASSEHGFQLSGISTSWFPKEARVISGDIHTPQQVGPVLYVGAPYTVDFGDDYEPRLLLIKEDALQSIPYNGPQKRLVDISSLKELSEFELGKGDIVKVRVHLEPGGYAQWANTKQQVQSWGEKHGYTIHSVLPVNPKAAAAAPQSNAPVAKSDQAILERHAERYEIDKPTLQVGLELMDEPNL